MNQNQSLRTSQQGIDLIKSFEGIIDGNPKTVNLDPYLCPAGYWTIGWGHVVKDPSGRMLKGKEMQPYAYAAYPNGITYAEAELLLKDDLQKFEEGVKRLVKVALSVQRFSALVSFAFNCGLDEDSDTIAEGLGDSTLLKLVNAGKFDLASKEFGKWISKGTKYENGLRKRRAAEAQLFLIP